MHRATWANASDANLAALPPHLARDTAVAFAVAGGLVVLGQLVFRRLTGRFAQEL
jgi:ABC-2 type transport system permease protein